MSSEENPKQTQLELEILSNIAITNAIIAQGKATCTVGLRDIHKLLNVGTPPEAESRIIVKIEAFEHGFHSPLTIQFVNTEGRTEKSKAFVNGRSFLKFLRSFLEEQMEEFTDPEDELPQK
jgi:hypothetical protein